MLDDAADKWPLACTTAHNNTDASTKTHQLSMLFQAATRLRMCKVDGIQ